MARDNDNAPKRSIGRTLLTIGLKIGKWLLILVLAVLGLYLIGVNLLLNSSFGRRLAMSHPEVVQVHFQRAWTIWPGRVHVTGADISGQDSENQFWLTAEHAAMTFTPGGLSKQDVTGTNLRGDGITIKIRRRVVKLPPENELAKLPPIKGFPTPLKPDLPDVRVIGVRLQDIKAKNVREIWVDGFRVTGDIDAEGGMYYKPRLAVRVYPSNIVIKDAKVTTGDEPVASQLKGTVWVNVEEIDLVTLAKRDLAQVSAAIDLGVHIDGLKFANEMLPKGKGISLEDGAAQLTMAVKIDKGVLGETSKLNLTMPNLGVTLPMFRARTGIEMGLTVDAAEHHAVFAAQLESLVLTQRSNGKADVRSKVIRFKGHNNTLDLTKKMTAELRVDMPAVVAGDLTFVNDFMPPGTAMNVERGAATLSGHFNLSTATNRANGMIDLEATKLLVRNKGAHIEGTVKVHGLLHELDLDTQNADLSGTWFALEDCTIFLDGKQTTNWKLRVDLTKAVVHPEAKRQMDATVKVYIKNFQPAVNVIGENVKVPWIAKALAYRENVVVNTHIELEKDSLTIPRLNVENDSFIVQGRLHMTELKRKPPHTEAAILIKIAGLTIGIEVHDKSIKPILINAQEWFDKREAVAGGPSASAAALQEGLEAGAALGAALGTAAGNASKPVVSKAVGITAGTTQPPAGTNVKPALQSPIEPKPVLTTPSGKPATLPPTGKPVPLKVDGTPAINPADAKAAVKATDAKPAATTPAGKQGATAPAANAPATKPAAPAPAATAPATKPAAPAPKPAATTPSAATPAAKPAAPAPAAKTPEAKSTPSTPETKSAPAAPTVKADPPSK